MIISWTFLELKITYQERRVSNSQNQNQYLQTMQTLVPPREPSPHPYAEHSTARNTEVSLHERFQNTYSVCEFISTNLRI